MACLGDRHLGSSSAAGEVLFVGLQEPILSEFSYHTARNTTPARTSPIVVRRHRARRQSSFILAGFGLLPYRADDYSVSQPSPCWSGVREVPIVERSEDVYSVIGGLAVFAALCVAALLVLGRYPAAHLWTLYRTFLPCSLRRPSS
jgi:hypothetical protein